MNFLTKTQKLKLYYKAVENASFIFGNKNVSPPIIAWLLTKRCNLKCMHCDSYLDTKKIIASDLITVAKKIAQSDVMIVILSGGEPMLVPNINEIITILKESGKIVKINTNGLNLSKHAEFLINSEVDSITISIDSMNPSLHDKIRGKQGSYKNAIEGLEYIKTNRKRKKPYTEVRCVVMKDNFREIPEFVKYFKTKADFVALQPIHNNESHHKIVSEDVLFEIEKNNIEEELKKMFLFLGTEFKEFGNHYYKRFPEFLNHPERMEKEAILACLPLWINFMPIDETGNCLSCSHIIGNVYNDDIQTIWSGKRRLDFLKSMASFGKCKTPCWLNCTSVAPLLIGSVVKKMLTVSPPSDNAIAEFRENIIFHGNKS